MVPASGPPLIVILSSLCSLLLTHCAEKTDTMIIDLKKMMECAKYKRLRDWKSMACFWWQRWETWNYIMRRWEVRVRGRWCLCTLIRFSPLVSTDWSNSEGHFNTQTHEFIKKMLLCLWQIWIKGLVFLYHDDYYYKLCYGLFSLQFLFSSSLNSFQLKVNMIVIGCFQHL